MEQEAYLNEKQAAELMRFSIFTLRNHRHLRKGPAYLQIGRSVRYRRSDIIAYLESRRIDPAAVNGETPIPA